jgi:hypothetical protein
MIRELRFDYREIVENKLNGGEEIFSEDSGDGYPFIPEINDAIFNLRHSKTDYIKLPTCDKSGVIVYDSLLIDNIHLDYMNGKKIVVFDEKSLGLISVNKEDNLIFMNYRDFCFFPLTLKELKKELKGCPLCKYERKELKKKLNYMTESYPDYQEIKELIEGL